VENFLAGKRCLQADKHIPPSHRQGRILDIGCGTYPLFLMRTSFAEKYGIDKLIDHGYLKSRQVPGVRLAHHNIEAGGALPFEDDFFDVVTMLAVYEHVEYDRLIDILDEIYRVLKPGGIHVATTPTAWTDRLLKGMARVRLVSPAEIEEHKVAYTRSRLLSMFRRTLFEARSVECGYFEMSMNLWVRAAK